MELTIRTAPARPAISLGEAKRHLGVADNDRDVDIERMIAAATDMLCTSTGRALITTEYRLKMAGFCANDGFTSFPIELPYPPIQTVDEITYYDVNGDEQTLSDYQLVAGPQVPAKLYPARAGGLVWPVTQTDRVDAVTIDFTAGYGDTADSVPAKAKQWLLLLVRHWYDNPSGVATGAIGKELEYALNSIRQSLGIGYRVHVQAQ